jgi:anaerobic ribonucleoside-triphosphate reductase
MYNVVKRDGQIVSFDISKIADAIKKAFDATNTDYTESVIDFLALKVTADFLPKIKDGLITVEDIQDSAEAVLSRAGYEAVGKAYILYRKQREKMRNLKNTYLDYKETVNKYLNVSDWRVKENSTVTYSVGGLILSNSGAVTANYWLSEVYDQEIADAHRNCDLHLHDLSMLTGYCAGWSLKQLITEGLGIPGKINSAPASHLSTLCNQMVNFLGIMQNEWAGAQAFSSFDTYLSAFVKADNLSYREVKQCIESFVFGVNTPSRWGTQAPFSNITLDWTVPDDLKDLPAIIGGKDQDFTYGDCKAEMDMVNRAFLEIMINGDANGRGFQYPIPTYSLTKDFDWSDTENNRLLFEMTSKYGTPYFSNYIGNTEMQPTDVRSMCCRLRLDLRELRKKSGGFFGSGESTGSIGVVTINLPRIAYLAKDKEDFYKRLDAMMDLSARSLKTKRDVVTRYLEHGLYPYTKRYLGTFNNHFSTIGLVGMNETALNANWIRMDLTHPEAQKFAGEVLDHMREKLSDYQVKYGDLYNLEATPAESTAYRLALHDKKKYPDIITAGTEESPYYTNSSNLPVWFTDDIFEAMDIQDPLQVKYTSGTVFHVFLGQKVTDWKATRTLVRKIAENHKLPYYTISPTYSVCQDHGYLEGEQWECPICHKKTEVYSRITGYYRPVQNWNTGKTQEFKERKEYKPEISAAMPILFTTKTCPNCPAAKTNLEKKGIAYKAVDAMENQELAQKYGIMGVPTLVPDPHDPTVVISGVNQIVAWANANGQRA